MKIGLYATENKESTHSVMLQLAELLKENEVEVFVAKQFDLLMNENIAGVFEGHQEMKALGLDYILSIGGDGTFLSTATLIRDSGIPVLGINTGRLGFLANVSIEKIEECIVQLLSGDFKIESRSMIALITDGGMFGDLNFALNEIALHKLDTSSMIVVHVEVDGQFLSSYWSDGLIISTPTGSTAYSMSCGGPILVPRNNSFIITPKAAHNLNVRPIVLPDDVEIKLRVEGREGNFLVSLDSRSESCVDEIVLTVRKAEFSLNLIKPTGSTFFTTMRNKLMWGKDTRN